MIKKITHIIQVSILIFNLSLLNIYANNPGDTIEKTQWFTDAKFGIFIHWNHISMIHKLIEEKGRIPGNDIGEKRKLPFEEMNKLIKEFSPDNFDADEWVKLYKQAGARYLTFTTYHSQISMFDNPYTNYDIMSSRFKMDITREIADATRDNGLKLFFYFGIGQPQWTPYPDGHKDINSPYYQYIYNLAEHLLTNYGKVDGVWWDGDHPYKSRNEELVNMARKHQPHILMTNRLGREHGDFGTPEQVIGNFNLKEPWESCIPIEGINWHHYGGRDIKHLETCLKMLINCVGNGGNLLLNISPQPDGNIQPEQKEVLVGMGKWLDKYGKGIYRTKGGPYISGKWGVSTRIDDRVYIYITQHQEEGRLVLPSLPANVISYKLLTDGKCKMEQVSDEYVFILDKIASYPQVATILELKLDKKLMNTPPIQSDNITPSLTNDAKVLASSQKFSKTPGNAVVFHSDLDGVLKEIMRERNSLTTAKEKNEFIARKEKQLGYTFAFADRHYKKRYWMADDSDKKPWIEIDMKKPVMFNQVQIVEHQNRTEEFEIQYFKKDEWITFYKGKKLNYFDLKCNPITTKKVRLLITRFEGGPPAIKIFDLF